MSTIPRKPLDDLLPLFRRDEYRQEPGNGLPVRPPKANAAVLGLAQNSDQVSRRQRSAHRDLDARQTVAGNGHAIVAGRGPSESSPDRPGLPAPKRDDALIDYLAALRLRLAIWRLAASALGAAFVTAAAIRNPGVRCRDHDASPPGPLCRGPSHNTQGRRRIESPEPIRTPNPLPDHE